MNFLAPILLARASAEARLGRQQRSKCHLRLQAYAPLLRCLLVLCGHLRVLVSNIEPHVFEARPAFVDFARLVLEQRRVLAFVHGFHRRPQFLPPGRVALCRAPAQHCAQRSDSAVQRRQVLRCGLHAVPDAPVVQALLEGRRGPFRTFVRGEFLRLFARLLDYSLELGGRLCLVLKSNGPDKATKHVLQNHDVLRRVFTACLGCIIHEVSHPTVIDRPGRDMPCEARRRCCQLSDALICHHLFDEICRDVDAPLSQCRAELRGRRVAQFAIQLGDSAAKLLRRFEGFSSSLCHLSSTVFNTSCCVAYQSTHAATSVSSCGVPISSCMRSMAFWTGTGHDIAQTKLRRSSDEAQKTLFYVHNSRLRPPDAPVATEDAVAVGVSDVQVAAVGGARQADYQ